MFLIFKGGYEKTPKGTPCDEQQNEITSEEECKRAGKSLGFPFVRAYGWNNYFPACFADSMDADNIQVYYNLSPEPRRTDFRPNLSAICKKKGSKCSFVLII